MEIVNRYVWIFVLWFVFLLPNFMESSWQSSACSIYGTKSCWDVSAKYEEPFCVTNKWGENYVNYVDTCVRTPLTNSLSTKWTWNNQRDLSQFSKRDIIEYYCSSLYWSSDMWRIYFAKPSMQTSGWDWQQTFDSHQSLFLYALCSSFTKSWENIFINKKTALVKDAFTWDLVKILKLQQMSDRKNLCSLDEKDNESLSECDMSIYATKIYSAIMSDLYKIKYAQVLNVNTIQNFSSDWQRKIEDFMTGYYLSEKEYRDLKDEYPKTLSILKSNQQYYKNVLSTVKIIDNSMLADLAASSKCPVDKNMIGTGFVACALHSSQRDGFALTPSFVTLLYNELLHYRQFIFYYQTWLNKRLGRESGLDEKDMKLLSSELSDFWRYSEKQMEATKSVQHDFEDFNMTYPWHIWMLMYIEKIEKYRNNSLSKVITSFYSLSEKLKNVQLPPSSQS